MASAPQIHVKLIETEAEMQDALRIRQIVFVEEQNVDPEIEYDEYEEVATHVIAYTGGVAIGTARWRMAHGSYKLERFAVLESGRGKGVGSALVRFVMAQLDQDHSIYLNSQMVALPFYQKLGFVAEGDIFYEANIPHRKMVYRSS